MENKEKRLRFKRKFHLTSTQVIVLGYFLVILLGSFLLALPIASKSRTWTPYLSSIFTATSATCVTGLVVVDTFTHWSIFGQLVILSLIQIGGIGFMTVITLFALFLKRQIGLFERTILMQSAGTMRMSGVVLLIKRIILLTALFEGTGTILLATSFCPKMGLGWGLYYSVFHSISAFCNAGFDLMGKYEQFSSLTAFTGDFIVNFTIAGLIFSGGLGFLVWSDIFDKKLHFSKYSLHSRIVLITTTIIIVIPAIIFFILEYNHAFKGFTIWEKIFASIFQSVSPRTAGFNTVDLTTLTNGSITLTTILMMVGGSPGSTAGGIKTTTIIIVLLGVIITTMNKPYIEIGKRRIDDKIVRQSNALFTMYLLVMTCAIFIMSMADPTVTIKEIIFEVASAIGTVGLSLGITAQLSIVSKVVLILLMFIGRVGALSLAAAFVEKKDLPPIQRPIEKIMIG